MPRKKKQEPKDFLKQDGVYPFGPFEQNVPEDALAAACFAKSLIHFMNGELPNDEFFELGKRESQLSLSVKAGVSQAVISRILAGRSYPDISTIANLEFYTRSQLWCGPEEREKLLRGVF